MARWSDLPLELKYKIINNYCDTKYHCSRPGSGYAKGNLVTYRWGHLYLHRHHKNKHGKWKKKYLGYYSYLNWDEVILMVLEGILN